jgi:LysM repeat protein
MFHTSVSNLVQLNNIKNRNFIKVGQVLKVSGTVKVTTVTTSISRIYIVKRGDVLSKIASANHTTVAKICSLNGIKNANKISIGQKLKIK